METLSRFIKPLMVSQVLFPLSFSVSYSFCGLFPPEITLISLTTNTLGQRSNFGNT